VLRPQVARIRAREARHHRGAGAIRYVVQRVAVGVRRQELQAAVQPPAGVELQGVVARGRPWSRSTGARPARSRATGSAGSGSGAGPAPLRIRPAPGCSGRARAAP
jgi:hypothetical protein